MFSLSKTYRLTPLFTRFLSIVSQHSINATNSSMMIFCQSKQVPVSSKTVGLEILQKAVMSRPFEDWKSRMDKHSGIMDLHGIDIQAVDMFGTRVGFIKFVANVTDKDGDKLPGSVFMRGGSVAVLPIIIDSKTKDKFTVLVKLDSVPTANSGFVSLPAGMVDDTGTFAGNMAREIKEEVGLDIKEDQLIDLTPKTWPCDYQACYPSVGGTDEFIKLFAFETEMESIKLKELQGKLTGLPEEHEKITLQIVPFEKIHEISPDMKALSALCLYDKYKKYKK